MDIAQIIEAVRPTFHIVLHVVVPAGIAIRYGGTRRWEVFVMLMASMLVDLDHLIADPIYAPGRCSIGFHPLHRWPAILIYIGLTFTRRGRWLGLGALVHMALDTLDCAMMS